MSELRLSSHQVHRLGHRQGSVQIGIGVAGQESGCRLVVDEGVIGEPLDGAAPGTGIAEGVPGWQQVRVLLVELSLKRRKAP